MNWQIEQMHERYEERMREITELGRIRIGRMSPEAETGMGGKTLAWLGHWLVAAGERLQTHAAPRA